MGKRLKRRAPLRGDKWHCDEVCLVVNKKKHRLWRAVDQDAHELHVLMQSRRNKQAAKHFSKKLLKGLQYLPRVIITDKLKNYSNAKKDIVPEVEYRQHKGLNNPAENSYQLTRQQEEQMRQFKSTKQGSDFYLFMAELEIYFLLDDIKTQLHG